MGQDNTEIIFSITQLLRQKIAENSRSLSVLNFLNLSYFMRNRGAICTGAFLRTFLVPVLTLMNSTVYTQAAPCPVGRVKQIDILHYVTYTFWLINPARWRNTMNQ